MLNVLITFVINQSIGSIGDLSGVEVPALTSVEANITSEFTDFFYLLLFAQKARRCSLFSGTSTHQTKTAPMLSQWG